MLGEAGFEAERVEPREALTAGAVRAIVWIPFDDDALLLSHLWSRGIPLFLPSLHLLASWETHLGLMADLRHWENAPRPASLRNQDLMADLWHWKNAPRPASLHDQGGFHPADGSHEALLHWLALLEWYRWPTETVMLFPSLDHVVSLLLSAPLEDISRSAQAAAATQARGDAAARHSVWEWLASSASSSSSSSPSPSSSSSSS
ncbi:hypothetical protein T484DRAFT_1894396, partial [Baffinella frigidus]